MHSLNRALVVNDDPVVQTIFKCFLACNQIRDVSVATSCAEAMNKVKPADPALELIVLDLDLPRADGLAFLAGLKAKAYLGKIVFSSSSRNLAVQRAVAFAKEEHLDFRGCIEKPITKKKLDDLANSISRNSSECTIEHKHQVISRHCSWQRAPKSVNF